MNKNQLRMLIFSDRATIKELTLTEHQEKIVRLVRDRGPITSNWFMKYQKTSLQNASQQLIVLFLKGYLSKKQVTSKTGGIENVFRYAL